MSADRDRGIRRQKQKRAKVQKKLARAEHSAASAAKVATPAKSAA